VTGKLGEFESDCHFGRYNSCVRAHQSEYLSALGNFLESQLTSNLSFAAYEFVKYGNCWDAWKITF
jgi:hypothetical protein